MLHYLSCHPPQNGHCCEVGESRFWAPPPARAAGNPVDARAVRAQNGHTGTILASGAARRFDLYVLQPQHPQAVERTQTKKRFPEDENLFLWQRFAHRGHGEAQRRPAVAMGNAQGYG